MYQNAFWGDFGVPVSEEHYSDTFAEWSPVHYESPSEREERESVESGKPAPETAYLPTIEWRE